MNMIRTLLAYPFLVIGQFILPKSWGDEHEDEEVPESDEKVENEAPVVFKDLSSYFEALKKPTGQSTAAIAICNNLREVSFKKQAPVRLNYIETVNYDHTGLLGNTIQCNVGGFEKERWYKLGDVKLNNQFILPVVKEMIEVMAQDGWGCMNDSYDQLVSYIAECVRNNQDYVVDRCRRQSVKATIRTNLYMVVDVTEGKKGRQIPSPRIAAKISVTVDGEGPVESEHCVHFHRKTNHRVESKA